MNLEGIPRIGIRNWRWRALGCGVAVAALAAGAVGAVGAVGATAVEERPFVEVEALYGLAASNGRVAAEAWERCHRYLHAWLGRSDAETGLIPRNLSEGGDYWNGRDAGADNYAFMVLAAAFTDPDLLEGRLLEMLRTEARLTARVDRLVDDYSFTRRGWRREALDLDATIFDSAEYVKDGLIPVTEWLGPSPWSERMIGILEDIWKHAHIETPWGPLPTLNFEVNGDLLQAGARVYWLTGDRRFLDWSVRLGDYYLLGDHHPTRDLSRLRLRDHGGEVVNGLTELYVALRQAEPVRADAYRQPLRAMFDRILEAGRNNDGMLYDWFDPQTGEHSQGICDTWGYVLDGFFTMSLLDGIPAYREAVRQALSNLQARYSGHNWEGNFGADGYADSIESALNLHCREPLPSVAAWIDTETRAMWAKQQPDGIVEGWHGDGNFARTSLMVALWKTQGVHPVPWREDLRVGAVRERGTLYLTATADRAWVGRLRFDRPRHREVLHLPMDYPRINQFPEWYAVEVDAVYSIRFPGEAEARSVPGTELRDGLDVSLEPGGELRLQVWRP